MAKKKKRLTSKHPSLQVSVGKNTPAPSAGTSTLQAWAAGGYRDPGGKSLGGEVAEDRTHSTGKDPHKEPS